ncbi:PREDICTED: uncharacterized protein LOC109128765 [Camelina sativa]|uniref:Uncharacterized protein LOC109128764 n=1 Tax=Camelina sativa TaxID=90675 RepID=A0ABM1QWW1_CAMSA|nr:PREDICTED: uncharacterized protein LOC109128764 [Camelina sativa]XP_019091250.1 PREDICTED: uncharacterized protein LOC109128765 [Camelina sativa]
MDNKTNDGHESVPPIHSQVVKIKREFEKIQHPSLRQPEMPRVLRESVSPRRSRSPLGLGERERPISVGN